jgi:integrase/recombinase XerD
LHLSTAYGKNCAFFVPAFYNGAMLQVYRRHNAARCKRTSRAEYKCHCPIWVDGYIEGKRVRRALKVRDWAKAQLLIRKWETEGERPALPVRVTVEDLKNSFLADVTARHLASETIRKYKHLFSQLDAFARARGLVFVSDLDLGALTAFRGTWEDGALSTAKKTARLRTIFHFAVAHKLAAENPAVKLKMPIVKPTPTLPFNKAEMERIIKASEGNARTLAFVYVLRYAGLRIGDCTTLRVTALEGDKLHLYTAKTGTLVRVPLPKFVAKALKALPHKHPDYFFHTGHSNVREAANTWRRRLAGVFTKAKIASGHAHRLRDTFAVELLQAGASLETVSMLLGHSNIQITQQHYAPWVAKRQELLEQEVYRINEIGEDFN